MGQGKPFKFNDEATTAFTAFMAGRTATAAVLDLLAAHARCADCPICAMKATDQAAGVAASTAAATVDAPPPSTATASTPAASSPAISTAADMPPESPRVDGFKPTKATAKVDLAPDGMPILGKPTALDIGAVTMLHKQSCACEYCRIKRRTRD